MKEGLKIIPMWDTLCLLFSFPHSHSHTHSLIRPVVAEEAGPAWFCYTPPVWAPFTGRTHFPVGVWTEEWLCVVFRSARKEAVSRFYFLWKGPACASTPTAVNWAFLLLHIKKKERKNKSTWDLRRRMDGSVYGLWCDGVNTVPPFGRVEKNWNTMHLSKMINCNPPEKSLISLKLLYIIILKITEMNIFEHLIFCSLIKVMYCKSWPGLR